MDFEYNTKTDKRESVRNKLSKKQVKHWYGATWRKITELHFTGGLSKWLQNSVYKQMGLSKEEFERVVKKKKR